MKRRSRAAIVNASALPVPGVRPFGNHFSAVCENQDESCRAILSETRASFAVESSLPRVIWMETECARPERKVFRKREAIRAAFFFFAHQSARRRVEEI